MMGRPPKPTALHQLHGTDRSYVKRRATSEPKPRGDLRQRDAPDYLNQDQRAAWAYAIRHAPAHLLKKLDRDILAGWVVAEDNFRLAVITQNRLNEQRPLAPLVVRGKDGLTPSPWFEIQDRMMKAMARASDQLGFSPVARPRIKLEPAAGDENPWAEFRVVNGGRPG